MKQKEIAERAGLTQSDVSKSLAWINNANTRAPKNVLKVMGVLDLEFEIKDKNKAREKEIAFYKEMNVLFKKYNANVAREFTDLIEFDKRYHAFCLDFDNYIKGLEVE